VGPPRRTPHNPINQVGKASLNHNCLAIERAPHRVVAAVPNPGTVTVLHVIVTTKRMTRTTIVLLLDLFYGLDIRWGSVHAGLRGGVAR